MINKYTFTIVKHDDIDWERIHNSPDHTTFKSKEWFDFIYVNYKVKPFIVEIQSDGVVEGYFCGVKFKKFFINFVAGPFEGFMTSFQGISFLNPIEQSERVNVYNQFTSFLFKNNICSFFQTTDFFLDSSFLSESDRKHCKNAYTLDLTRDIDELFKSFSYSSCRYSINKSKKLGVVVKPTENVDTFIDHYFNQLGDVFEKQNLSLVHSRSEVSLLIKSVYPSGNLLLLEAISEDNVVIATGIFTGVGKLATFYGAASWRKYQHLCPNEAVVFEGIKIMKSRGIERLEFGGGGKYKEKYAPEVILISKIIRSKYEFLIYLKNKFKKYFYLLRENKITRKLVKLKKN